jgi:hypothetical protein
MTAALRHPIVWVFLVLVGLTVAWNAIGAPVTLCCSSSSSCSH